MSTKKKVVSVARKASVEDKLKSYNNFTKDFMWKF